LVQQKIMVGRMKPGHDPDALEKVKAAAPNLTIDSIRTLVEHLLGEFDRIVAVLTSVGWVTLCIAGLGVANVMFMKILRQRRQIGILRAMGLTRPQSVGLVMIESLIIGVLGGLVGIVLGVHLAINAVHLDRTILGMEYALVFPAGFIGLAV